MYSVEFESQPENGIIKIPDKYSNLNRKNLKVILILHDEKTEEENQIEKFFNKYSVDLNSFTFNREEANER